MVLPFLLIILPLLQIIIANPIPSPTTASASPASHTTSHFPAPTKAPLVDRCEGGHCEFGGSETTLQASVVTSTILSTTSVPCYVTTYITNSETVTETVYSTETITSTETREGTVFIIQYSPTPVLMSVPVTSIIEITNTWWSYWLTTDGSAYQVTSSGGEKTYGGETTTCTTTSGGGWGDGGDSGIEPATKDAWTHVNNAVEATSVTEAGVTVASNHGWESGAGSTIAGNGVTGGTVNWANAGAGSRRAPVTVGWEVMMVVFLSASFILV